MADVRADCEIVTKFLLDTCGLHRRLNFDAVFMLTHCEATPCGSPDDNENKFIPLITGSNAEFYIQPMLSCIDDHDIMVHSSDELAIPAGTVPPTQLPDGFDSRVEVYEIVDTEFPGYVYLVSSYLLTECIDNGTYTTVECPRAYIIRVHRQGLHGPAFVTEWLKQPTQSVARLAGTGNTLDLVCCTRCLLWPTQAADWPTRHRNYCWPDPATVVSCIMC